jgi:hypothetical protein
MTITLSETSTGVLVSFTSQDQHACVRATEFVPNDQIPDLVGDLLNAYKGDLPGEADPVPYVPEVCDHCGKPVEPDGLDPDEWAHVGAVTRYRWLCENRSTYAEVAGTDKVQETYAKRQALVA